MQNNLFTKWEDNSQKHLKKFIKDKYFESILPSTIELTEILNSKEIPILKINLLIRKIGTAIATIEMNMRAEVNVEYSKVQKQAYQLHLYKQLEELYDEYGDADGNVNWERIKKEKAKFLKTFPLKDAIAAAKLVQSGELEV